MASPDLARLYDEHASALFAFALNVTRNEADTRDVLQEVFRKLTARPELLREVRDERGFLLRLTHHAAIDQMRRRGTRERNHEQFAAEAVALFASTTEPDEAAIFEARMDR